MLRPAAAEEAKQGQSPGGACDERPGCCERTGCGAELPRQQTG
jgi:hypothetical protein